GRRLRRRADLRPRRRSHWPHQASGDLQQRLLRRREAQSPLHDRQPVAVCGVCGGPGGTHNLTSNPFPEREGEKTSEGPSSPLPAAGRGRGRGLNHSRKKGQAMHLASRTLVLILICFATSLALAQEPKETTGFK